MLPSATDLTYFLEIAEAGNISRAAERLGVSQPTLSQAMRRLEDSLGNAILLRSSGGVRLTKVGHRLKADAGSLLESWQRLRATASQDEGELRGRYTIGAHPAVAIYSLPTILRNLLCSYPRLELSLEHGLSRHICDSVISFRTDFGIVINPVRHPELVIKPVAKDQVGLWRSRNHTKSNDPQSAEFTVIGDRDLLQVRSIRSRFEELSQRPPRFMSSSSLEVVRALTLAGVGVGILPGRVAAPTQRAAGRNNSANTPENATKNAVTSTELIALPGTPTFEDELALIYRADVQQSKAAKTLLRALTVGLTEQLTP